MKKIAKRLSLRVDTVRVLDNDTLRDAAGGECPTYERNCSMGLCPGSDWATCRSIMVTGCAMCSNN